MRSHYGPPADAPPADPVLAAVPDGFQEDTPGPGVADLHDVTFPAGVESPVWS